MDQEKLHATAQIQKTHLEASLQSATTWTNVNPARRNTETQSSTLESPSGAIAPEPPPI
jgi:hypothetical protein